MINLKPKRVPRLGALLWLMLLTLVPPQLSARDFTYTHEGQTITYTVLSEEDKTVETKQSKEYVYDGNYASGILILPAHPLDGDEEYTLVQIGKWGFDGCDKLTSVEIPNTVTNIGISAFQYCRRLRSVEIPNSVTTIGDKAFYHSGLTSVNIPNLVMSIGDNTFALCSSLTSVEIPGSVTTIGSSAFEYCSGLTSVEIPSSVTTIGSYAFRRCSGLTSMEIPSSVTTIGSYAFRDCSGLTSVEIPSSVTTIESSAFEGCSGLTSVEIPSSVTTIGNSAFSGCSGLTSVEIPGSVTTIESSAFEGCSGLTSVEIPSSVTTIGASAFSGCSGLTSVEIPSSVTTIGASAFSGCSGLTSVIFNEDCEIGILEANAFRNCTSLEYFRFCPSLTKINSTCFDGANVKNLISLPVSSSIDLKNVNGLENIEVYGTGSEITWAASVPETVVSVKGRPEFLVTVTNKYASTLLASKVIVDYDEAGVHYVSESADEPYHLLGTASETGTTVIVPAPSLTADFTCSFPDGIFDGCEWVESVEWNNPTVPASAFNGATALKNLTLGDNVTELGANAFKNTHLTELIIPAGLTSIGAGCFAGTDILNIKSFAVIPPALGENGFTDTADGVKPTVVVPAGSLSAYQSDPEWSKLNLSASSSTDNSGWSYTMNDEWSEVYLTGIDETLAAQTDLTFPTSIAVADGFEFPVTKILAGTFKDKGAQTKNLTIPANIVEIEQGAFEGLTTTLVNVDIEEGEKPLAIGENNLGDSWTKLASMTIGRNISNIGDVAIFGSMRTTFKTLVIKDNVTALPANIFKSARALTDGPVFGAGLVEIGANAFASCTKMTKLSLPASLKVIGDQAFASCTALKNIDFNGAELTSIGASAFEGKLKPTDLKVKAENIGDYAFKDWSLVEEAEIEADKIGVGAFQGAAALKKVKIIANSIAENSFAGVTELDTLQIDSYDTFELKYGAFPDVMTADFVSVSGNGTMGGNFAAGATINTMNLDVTTVGGTSAATVNTLAFGNKVEYISGFSDKTINNLSFGTGLKTIASKAFQNCKGLTEVEIPSVEGAEAVIQIGDNAFNRSSLKKIKLGNRVKSIGNGTFYGCYLEDPDLGTSVQTIGYDNFILYTKGTLSIPASVTSMVLDGNLQTENIFFQTLSKIRLEDGDKYLTLSKRYYSSSNKIFFSDLYIGRQLSNTLQIDSKNVELSDNKDLNLTIQNPISVYGGSLKIGGGCKKFAGTVSDKNYTLEICDGVEEISGTLPMPVQKSLTIPASVKTIGSKAFTANAKSELSQIIFADGEGVTSMAKDAFSVNENVTDVYIGHDVKCTGDAVAGALAANFPNLDKAIIGDNMETLGAYTFKDCVNLTNVIVPDGLKHVGQSAYENCTGLKVLSMSENLLTIDHDAYKGCSGLERIVARSMTPAESASGVDFSFDEEIYENVPLYVPDDVVDDYWDADLFWQFATVEGSGDKVASGVEIEEKPQDGEDLDPGFNRPPGSTFWLIIKAIYDHLTGHHAPARAIAKAGEENTPQFYWYSTNNDIATVTPEGEVTILKEEPVEIWGYVLDGSDKKAVVGINDVRITHDLNGDGVIDGVDVNMLIKHIIAPEGSSFKLKQIDYNGDSVIDGVDLNYLIKKTL